jgi:hypothetical protein
MQLGGASGYVRRQPATVKLRLKSGRSAVRPRPSPLDPTAGYASGRPDHPGGLPQQAELWRGACFHAVHRWIWPRSGTVRERSAPAGACKCKARPRLRGDSASEVRRVGRSCRARVGVLRVHLTALRPVAAESTGNAVRQWTTIRTHLADSSPARMNEWKLCKPVLDMRHQEIRNGALGFHLRP